MKSKRKYVRPDTAAAARLQKAIADGGIFHAYLFEGSSRSNEELAGWFAAAALCECRDGRICGECVHCRQIADGVSPYIVRVKTAAEEVPEDTESELTGAADKAQPQYLSVCWQDDYMQKIDLGSGLTED